MVKGEATEVNEADYTSVFVEPEGNEGVKWLWLVHPQKEMRFFSCPFGFTTIVVANEGLEIARG